MTLEIAVGYWKTRDGRKARVLCTDAPGLYLVVGYIFIDSLADHEEFKWAAGGSANACRSPSPSDLLGPWVEPKTAARDIWVWLWCNGNTTVAPYGSPRDPAIIGAKKVTVTVTEGVWE